MLVFVAPSECGWVLSSETIRNPNFDGPGSRVAHIQNGIDFGSKEKSGQERELSEVSQPEVSQP